MNSTVLYILSGVRLAESISGFKCISNNFFEMWPSVHIMESPFSYIFGFCDALWSFSISMIGLLRSYSMLRMLLSVQWYEECWLLLSRVYFRYSPSSFVCLFVASNFHSISFFAILENKSPAFK